MYNNYLENLACGVPTPVFIPVPLTGFTTRENSRNYFPLSLLAIILYYYFNSYLTNESSRVVPHITPAVHRPLGRCIPSVTVVGRPFL